MEVMRVLEETAPLPRHEVIRASDHRHGPIDTFVVESRVVTGIAHERHAQCHMHPQVVFRIEMEVRPCQRQQVLLAQVNQLLKCGGRNVDG